MAADHVFGFSFEHAGCRHCGKPLDSNRHRNPGPAYEQERDDAIRLMVDRVVAASVECGFYTAEQVTDPRVRIGTYAEVAGVLLDRLSDRWTDLHPSDLRKRAAVPYQVARLLLTDRAAQRRVYHVAEFLVRGRV